MARFTNQAQLIYNNVAIPSNIAVGEITEVLEVSKTALVGTYVRGDKVTYVISLVNSGDTELTGIQVSDNMGGYQFDGRTLYPMAYVPNSAALFINGVPQGFPTVTPGTPTVFSGFSVPANGNATIVYETQLNDYAPLAPADNITNTATTTGAGLANPAIAQEVINPVADAQLAINKAIDPIPVADGGTLTYTFTISNSGSAPVETADNVTITDTFRPVLSDLNVTFNGTPWVENTDYTYNPATGVFTSLAGNITVPEATFLQDQATGTWSANPGTSTLIIRGTV